jgi:ATP-dependent Clp protease ATP-binding subunit ClpX
MAKEIRMFVLEGKKPETNLLIAGIDAHICDKCIEQARNCELKQLVVQLAGDLIAKQKKLERS